MIGNIVAAALILLASTATGKPAPCDDPQGVQWAVYQNPFGPDSTRKYKEFNPEYIKTQSPIENNITSHIGSSGDGAYDYFYLYNDYDYAVSEDYFILDFRGYIKSHLTGEYSFTIQKHDDIVEFWLGRHAYSGFKRKNAAYNYPLGEGQFTITRNYRFAKGSYTPFRIVFGQGSGPFAFAFTIRDPTGTTILGPSSNFSSSIVQYSCSNPKAPPFPPYGSET